MGRFARSLTLGLAALVLGAAVPLAAAASPTGELRQHVDGCAPPDMPVVREVLPAGRVERGAPADVPPSVGANVGIRLMQLHLCVIYLFAALGNKLADELSSARLVLRWLFGVIGAPLWMVGLLVPIREAGALLPQLCFREVVVKFVPILQPLERRAVRRQFTPIFHESGRFSHLFKFSHDQQELPICRI